MKKLRAISLLLIVMLSAFIISGCSGGKSKQDKPSSPAHISILHDNVIVISEDNMHILKQVTPTSLTLSDTSNITVGTVLAGGITKENPSGFIRIVKSIDTSNSDGFVVLQTEEGKLTDVYEELDITAEIPIDFSLSKNGDVTPISRKIDWENEFGGLKLPYTKPILGDKDNGLIFEGEIQFHGYIRFREKIKVGKEEITTVVLGLNSSVSAGLNLTGELSTNITQPFYIPLSSNPIELQTLYIPTFPPIPVNITMSPMIEVVPTVNLKGEIKIIKVGFEANIEGGVEYNHDTNKLSPKKLIPTFTPICEGVLADITKGFKSNNTNALDIFLSNVGVEANMKVKTSLIFETKILIGVDWLAAAGCQVDLSPFYNETSFGVKTEGLSGNDAKFFVKSDVGIQPIHGVSFITQGVWGETKHTLGVEILEGLKLEYNIFKYEIPINGALNIGVN